MRTERNIMAVNNKETKEESETQAEC
jgi:hypothetical protein